MLLDTPAVAIMSGDQVFRLDPRCRILVSAASESRITEFIEFPTMASLAVCLGFPGRAIGPEKVAIASLHLERIGRVLPGVAQRPPTSLRTAPAHPELAFGSARPRPAQLIEVVVLVAGVFNDDTTVYGGIHIHVDTIT